MHGSVPPGGGGHSYFERIGVSPYFVKIYRYLDPVRDMPGVPKSGTVKFGTVKFHGFALFKQLIYSMYSL